MIKQAFQHAELRDANDNIIQQGAYGKRSALANSTNDAWIDFVMNNLEVLYDDEDDIKAYADQAAADAAAALVDSAPETLDTLNELAAALGNDPNFATTIVTLIDTKCAQAKAEAMLAAHPVGSYYESADSTSPATLFGGTWQEQIPDGELIGSIAAFAGGSLPVGWLLCDGSAISRTTYSALFNTVGTIYGTGDDSTTFNIPNLVDKFIEGAATAGIVKAAGLPNITGNIDIWYWGVQAAGGAFSAITSGNIRPGTQTTQTGYARANFNASSSNSIYGNSTTVQPPALTMRYAIYTGNVGKYCWLRQS